MRDNPEVICYCTILLLACVPLFGQQYTITTIAGNGISGVILSNPTSVAVDLAGDLYVGDWSGLVRKVWVRYGSTTTIAGTGILGYSGDGGPGASAMVGRAVILALDLTGNLFIADGDNNRIRRVDASTGIITTVAGSGSGTDSGDGGPAVDAGVSGPTGVTIDRAGDLYFSSSWTRIRKLTARTGMIETIAGQFLSGSSGDGGMAIDALFWDPVPSAISRNGDLYIADFENSRIRMIAPKPLVVTTVAGSGTCIPSPAPLDISVCHSGFAGDGGLAASATLNYPESVALDPNGNLYIADTINHRIRRIDSSTGVISTIAGTGVEGFTGDGGPALAAKIGDPVGITVDTSGKVYFADESNNRIRMLTPSGPQPAHLPESPRH